MHVDLDDVVEIEYTDWEVQEDGIIPKMVEVRRTVKISVLELVAAICGDSIGYATPMHAIRHVEEYLNGQKDAYCERAVALFGGDLRRLIESAMQYWVRLNEDKRMELLDFVKKWLVEEMRDVVAGEMISLMFPTSF